MNPPLKSEFDVAIIGAGPAGSTAAIRLAQNGLRVLLVEQKRFPREKLCGEFISPECLSHFAELNVLDQMSLSGGSRLERTIFYARNGRSVTVPSEWFGADSHALGLSRAEMDDVLLKRAQAAGAEVLEETQALGLLRENHSVHGVRLRLRGGEIHEVQARLTLDATGRGRVLARQVEKAAGALGPGRAKFVAFKAHVENVSVPGGDCEIYAYPGGYGGCNQVEGERHNLCYIVPSGTAKKYRGDAALIMANVLFANRRAASALSSARVVDDWLAVPIENYGRSTLAPTPGMLTIGDAAAFIDPFTGSGILLALESAKLASAVVTTHFRQTVSKYDFMALAADYEKQYGAALDSRLRVCSLLRRAAFVPFLAEVVIRGLGLSEALTHRLAKATRA